MVPNVSVEANCPSVYLPSKPSASAASAAHRNVLVRCRSFIFFTTAKFHGRLVALASRICLIAADGLVLVVTWIKTSVILMHAKRLGMRMPLATVLLRDGE